MEAYRQSPPSLGTRPSYLALQAGKPARTTVLLLELSSCISCCAPLGPAPHLEVCAIMSRTLANVMLSEALERQWSTDQESVGQHLIS